VTDFGELRREAARLVRQRLDMGETEWVLPAGQADALLKALRSAGRSAGGRPPPAGPTGEAAANVARPVQPEERPIRPEAPRQDEPRRVAAAEPAKRAVPSGVPLPVLPDDLEGLREVALACTRCGLAEGRTQVVFSDGATSARLMVVGEAPGANEDETGTPFVGAAGKFLDLLLASVDLSRRDSVYICNVIKCRPPGNRNPEPGEIAACAPFLLKQIELVRPEAILAVGSFAAQLLTGQEKAALGRLRGEVRSYQGVPLVVTYHPAALLRNGNWTRAFWDDLQLLREVLDGGPRGAPEGP